MFLEISIKNFLTSLFFGMFDFDKKIMVLGIWVSYLYILY